MPWKVIKYLLWYPLCLVIGHEWHLMGNGYKCCKRCTTLKRWEL